MMIMTLVYLTDVSVAALTRSLERLFDVVVQIQGTELLLTGDARATIRASRYIQNVLEIPPVAIEVRHPDTGRFQRTDIRHVDERGRPVIFGALPLRPAVLERMKDSLDELVQHHPSFRPRPVPESLAKELSTTKYKAPPLTGRAAQRQHEKDNLARLRRGRRRW